AEAQDRGDGEGAGVRRAAAEGHVRRAEVAGRGRDAEHDAADDGRDAREGRVSLGLILSEIVRAENLGPKPEQVKALVQEAAQTYEQPEAVVRWHYEKPERLKDFEAL